MNKKTKILLNAIPLILSFPTATCVRANTNNIRNSNVLENKMPESSTSENNENLYKYYEQGSYREIIEEYKDFITSIVEEDSVSDEQKWMEQPWGNLRAHFSYLKNCQDLKKDACYALKDLNGNGKPELILLLNDYTILAIYTLSEDNTPKLVDHYWERYQGFLYEPIDWDGDGEGNKNIYICSYSSNGVSENNIKLSTIQDPRYYIDPLLVEEQYTYNENITEKAYPYYGSDGGRFGPYCDTHCFYSNMELGTPIAERYYRDAYEKYVTTDQTKKVGLELKNIFNIE